MAVPCADPLTTACAAPHYPLKFLMPELALLGRGACGRSLQARSRSGGNGNGNAITKREQETLDLPAHAGPFFPRNAFGRFDLA